MKSFVLPSRSRKNEFSIRRTNNETLLLGKVACFVFVGNEESSTCSNTGYAFTQKVQQLEPPYESRLLSLK